MEAWWFNRLERVAKFLSSPLFIYLFNIYLFPFFVCACVCKQHYKFKYSLGN